jgi:integrase
MTPGQILSALKPGQFVGLEKVKPSGSLGARRALNGSVNLFWRYTIGQKTERVAIGDYDPTAPPKSVMPGPKGYSIAAAVRAAQDLAIKHQQNKERGGYRAFIKAEIDAKADAKRAAAKAAADAEAVKAAEAAAKMAAARYALTNLLDDYCDHLEVLGRRSHYDARNIFQHHVKNAWPNVAALPANEITAEQVADMMRKLTDAGKGRTSNKLRSYVRAAYQTARAAKSKASIPLKFKNYCVVHNPAADTEPDESQNKADRNPLCLDDLRKYWTIIKDVPGFAGAALRVHLLTGAQRIEQLVKLRTADIGDATITLYDGKGRPGKPPRPHTVPLLPQAAAALKECKATGEYALSTSAGQKPLAATTLSRWAQDLAVAIPEFQAKRIRSGVETLLASQKVPKDIRGRLQSHGVSGVQARHYDGHEYIDEKREALVTLYASLTRKPRAKVITHNSKAEKRQRV